MYVIKAPAPGDGSRAGGLVQAGTEASSSSLRTKHWDLERERV